jgi:hypothetical protein
VLYRLSSSLDNEVLGVFPLLALEGDQGVVSLLTDITVEENTPGVKL